jgi:lipopolysaccharide export system permease protein
MQTYSRYMIGQVMRPMIAILLVALAALLAERMLRVVDIVVGWRGSLLVMLEMLGYLVPHYMGLALPAAFFIGILLAVSRLSREGELDAMRASGLGLHQLLRPLMGVGLVLMVINTLLLSHLQPYSRYAYRAALFALSDVSFQALLRERLFVTIGTTTYTADTVSPDREKVGGLFLYSRREDTDGALVVTAERGNIVPPHDGMPLTLELENGVQQYVPGDQEAGDASMPEAATVKFRNFTSDLKGAEPKSFRPRGEDEREYTLPELWQSLGTEAPGIRPAEFSAEFHGRLVRILATLALPLVAVPLAVRRQRAQRSYGIVVGLVLIILFNQVVQFGESLVDDGQIPAWLGAWVPLGVFTLIGLVLLWHRNWHVPRHAAAGRLDGVIDAMLARARALCRCPFGRRRVRDHFRPAGRRQQGHAPFGPGAGARGAALHRHPPAEPADGSPPAGRACRRADCGGRPASPP